MGLKEIHTLSVETIVEIGLSLRWAQISECMFSHVAVQISKLLLEKFETTMIVSNMNLFSADIDSHSFSLLWFTLGISYGGELLLRVHGCLILLTMAADV